MTSDEIKESVSMIEVVGRYGFHPNRAGFISCPFHHGDRTPSMKIYPKDYHCHACGSNGDIFSFVMNMENCDFKTAFSILGGTYNHSKTKFANQIRKEKLLRQREDERKKEQFKADFKKEIIITWNLVKAAQNGFEPYSDDWCYAINQEPWLIGLWEHVYINDMKVNEIDVLRKCREIRCRILTLR
jgi:hypothetical protein